MPPSPAEFESQVTPVTYSICVPGSSNDSRHEPGTLWPETVMVAPKPWSRCHSTVNLKVSPAAALLRRFTPASAG